MYRKGVFTHIIVKSILEIISETEESLIGNCNNVRNRRKEVDRVGLGRLG